MNGLTSYGLLTIQDKKSLIPLSSLFLVQVPDKIFLSTWLNSTVPILPILSGKHRPCHFADLIMLVGYLKSQVKFFGKGGNLPS